MPEDDIDTQGQETDTSVEVDSSQAVDAETQVVPSGGNPAWQALREAVPELTFAQIEPHLKEFDSNAQKRIETLNGQLAPWKALQDAGITPDRAAAANDLALRIDADPAAVYASLGEFLQNTGRMPSQQELVDAVDENAGVEDGEQQAPAPDPRIAQLEASQQQMLQFLQVQENEKIAKRADKALDKEIDTFKEAHPELSKQDVGEILRRAADTAARNSLAGVNKVPTLEESAAEFFALRNRILSTPRPGDSAPLLAPTSGGVPTGQPQKTLGQLSSQETQDLLADLIERSKTA